MMSKEKKKNASEEVKDTLQAEAMDEMQEETVEAGVEVTVIDDRDKDAESLIHWGAARAGVIVVAPLLGTVSLIANEVYMISKIGSVYGSDIPQKAVLSFIGSLGATVVGTTIATLLPLPFIQIPVAVSVTYGVGKAAVKWIKDGMPDDTRPYKEIFEEGREEGSKLAEEIKEDPNKDIPLGDEKEDFTKAVKNKINEIYPDKAHDTVDKLSGQFIHTFNELGGQLTEVLKKVGMTEEQIEKAKYTTLGAAEVAKETAEKAAKDLQAIAKVKAKEFKKDAKKKAEEMKIRAKEHMEELEKKRNELKEQSEIHAQQAKIKSEEMKEQAKEHLKEAKVQTDKLREEALAQAENAQNKAKEIKEKMNDKAGEYKNTVTNMVNQAKENVKNYAEDFRAKVEERGARKQAEAKGETVETSGKSKKTSTDISEE